ncbi:MAG: fatty acid desaturase [Phycisphaeraceae bacterium]
MPDEEKTAAPGNEASAGSAGHLPLPTGVNRKRRLYVYIVAFVVMHVLALAALIPWLFSWTALFLFIAGIYFFGQGINLCYHRVLTHRSVALPRWLEHFWTLIALCCMEDTPCKWVTTHRHHHKHSDEPEDPHSPRVTFWWSHFQWLTLHNSDTHSITAFQKYSKDILADPFYMRLEKNVWLSPLVYLAHVALFILAGALLGWLSEGTFIGAVQGGLSFLVWGVILRTVAVWHITWSVNSLTHTFGYRNHDTDDRSRNNWIVGVLASGEGWHNNHHHDQASACNQHRWWELDLTYCHIVILKWMGLAKDIILPRHIRQQRNAEARAMNQGAGPDSSPAPSGKEEALNSGSRPANQTIDSAS